MSTQGPVETILLDIEEGVYILNRYFIGLAAILSWYIARLGPSTSMEKASMESNGNDEVDIAVMSHFPVVQQLRLWK